MFPKLCLGRQAYNPCFLLGGGGGVFCPGSLFKRFIWRTKGVNQDKQNCEKNQKKKFFTKLMEVLAFE